MDHISKEKTIENVVQEEPPSYQVLFHKPHASDDVQYQAQSTVSTDNYQCRQPLVIVQSNHSQSISTIKSHILWSVLNILFCCCCFGCVACCFSMKTKNLKEEGDFQGALKASKTARNWNRFTTIFGIIMFFIDAMILYSKIAS